jgi:creatinine amidohydrolase
MHLHEIRPDEFQKAIRERWPLLLPAGCIEYHGPHLPLGTDTIIVQELLRRVARQTDCVVAPPLWYGPTGYAVTGPDQGTMDVSTERFGRHAKDVLASFWEMGFHCTIVCIHHQQMDGPEALAIRQAAAEVTFEKTLAERGDAWWGKAPPPEADNTWTRLQVWPSVLEAAARQGVVMADHAGYFETALLMAARPDLARLETLGPDAPWFSRTEESMAAKATVEAGEAMWQAMVSAWVEKLSALRR